MKVYYNGSCNICNAEISHYKKNNDHINFIDISESVDEHIKHLSKKQLFRRMHVYHECDVYLCIDIHTDRQTDKHTYIYTYM